MSPDTILLIIKAIQAAIAAAPQVEAIAIKAKEFITSLFTAQVITAAQQDAIHAHIDSLAAAAAANQPPPEFLVEADPV